MGNVTITKAADAAAKVTGKRYCSHHQGEAAVDAGSYVMCNKTKRCICNRCQDKSRRRLTEIQAAQYSANLRIKNLGNPKTNSPNK